MLSLMAHGRGQSSECNKVVMCGPILIEPGVERRRGFVSEHREGRFKFPTSSGPDIGGQESRALQPAIDRRVPQDPIAISDDRLGQAARVARWKRPFIAEGWIEHVADVQQFMAENAGN